MTRVSVGKLFVLIAAISGGAACEDDAEQADAGAIASREDAHAHGNEDVKDAAAAADSGTEQGTGPIILAERVFLPEGRMYYVSVLSEMPQGPVDRKKAREFMSADIELYDGKLYVRDRFSNTLTRFSVSDDLELVEEAQLSLQSTGLPDNRISSAYLSKTRAYFMSDDMDLRLVEWNPSSMELTGKEISLESVGKQGVSTYLSPPTTLGDHVIANINWQNYETLTTYPGTGVLVLDSADPGATRVIEDSRIAAGYVAYPGQDGAAYHVGLVGGDFGLFGKTTDGSPMPTSGVLRIGPDASEFDPDYLVDVAAITQSPGIWAIHRIDDRTLLVQMWDPEVPTDKLESADDFNNAEEFIYALVDTEDKTWKPLDEIERGGAGNSLDHSVDGHLYVQSYNENDATVYAVSATGIEPQFNVPGGDLWYLSRLH